MCRKSAYAASFLVQQSILIDAIYQTQDKRCLNALPFDLMLDFPF